jgi:4-carboxymuconolactone decarboxylase
VLPSAAGEGAQALQIARSGSQPTRQGPADNFTGPVRVDPLFEAKAPARASGAAVTFELALGPPGTRTRWARSCS